MERMEKLLEEFINNLKKYDCNIVIKLWAYRDLDGELLKLPEEHTIRITQVKDEEKGINDFILY